MSNEDVSSSSTDELVGIARLLNHIKENNVSWMVGMLVAYQLGMMDQFWTYGTGLCS
jgi:hypothetical protein